MVVCFIRGRFEYKDAVLPVKDRLVFMFIMLIPILGKTVFILERDALHE